MKSATTRIAKLFALLILCGTLGACDDPQIYGSVGVSSYGGGGYYGGTAVDERCRQHHRILRIRRRL